MRAPCISAALLYALASLLLAQVLASAPQANSQSARSKSSMKGIDARDAISWLKAQRTEDARPRFEARLATADISPDNVAPRGALSTADTTPVETRRENDLKAHLERTGADGIPLQTRTQQAMLMNAERENDSGRRRAGPDDDANIDGSAFVKRSAAPKVFGVNIFLIMAWLALIYLMYRTGSY